MFLYCSNFVVEYQLGRRILGEARTSGGVVLVALLVRGLRRRGPCRIERVSNRGGLLLEYLEIEVQM